MEFWPWRKKKVAPPVPYPPAAALYFDLTGDQTRLMLVNRDPTGRSMVNVREVTLTLCSGEVRPYARSPADIAQCTEGELFVAEPDVLLHLAAAPSENSQHVLTALYSSPTGENYHLRVPLRLELDGTLTWGRPGATVEEVPGAGRVYDCTQLSRSPFVGEVDPPHGSPAGPGRCSHRDPQR